MFIVKQQNRTSKKWNPISRFNAEGFFLGPAVFSSREDAEEYLKLYEKRILAYDLTKQQRYEEYMNSLKSSSNSDNNSNNDNNGRKKIILTKTKTKRNAVKPKAFELAVFEENELPALETPIFKRKTFTEI